MGLFAVSSFLITQTEWTHHWKYLKEVWRRSDRVGLMAKVRQHRSDRECLTASVRWQGSDRIGLMATDGVSQNPSD